MTYEYLCKACNHQWEAEQSIKDAPLKTCPRCGKDEAQRQISRSGGFILKGGGWYSDLYSSSKPAASGPSSSETTTTAKADATSSSTSASTSTTPKSSGSD